MKVNVGTYSKTKKLPRVYGPKRKINRKVLASKIATEKKKANKKNNRKKTLLYIIIITFFLGISVLIWRFNSTSARVTYTDGNEESCINIFNPTCWTENFKPVLKQTDNFTNALVVGVDSRPTGEESGLMNTDAIIIASLNHEKKKVMLLSVPRDLLIDVYVKDYYCCRAKVNSVYALAGARSDVDVDGLEFLAQNLERLLDIKIHYKASVNFEAVKDGVDAVGGIDVEVPTPLTVNYPKAEPPYDNILVKFEEGLQHMDGETALTWARFRKVYIGDMSFASDFSRADRQQQVISSLKDKALEDRTDITQMANKYWGIFNSISDNVDIEGLTLEDLLAGASLITDYDTEPVNVVLDPSFGGYNQYIITGQQTENFGYNIQPLDFTFAQIRSYIDYIWENPNVYDEEAIVVLSNRTGLSFTLDSKESEFINEDIPFYSLHTITEYAQETDDGVVIYDFSGGKVNSSIEKIKEYFPDAIVITDPSEQGITQSGYYEDIKIVIAPIKEVESDTTTTE